MDAFLDDIFNGCGEKVRDEILRMAAADRTDIRVATEEYLARMAEDGTDRSLWDRIVTAFRNLLRKLGFCLEIGTRELRGILAASRKNLTQRYSREEVMKLWDELFNTLTTARP